MFVGVKFNWSWIYFLLGVNCFWIVNLKRLMELKMLLCMLVIDNYVSL